MNARATGAAGLIVTGLACQEVGAALAFRLFPETGPLGMVMLRLAFSALLLLAIARPRLRGRSRADLRSVLWFGVVLAAIGLDPWNILVSIRLLFQRIWDLGFDAISGVWRYFLLGAVIVIPIWLLTRLFGTPRGR